MVSRIRILGIPYDDCVVRVQIHQYSVCSHPAHVRVQIDYWITIVDVTSKVQAASIVLKYNVDEGLVCETLSSGTLGQAERSGRMREKGQNCPFSAK